MSNKYRDFDAFFAEQEKKPDIVIRLFDREYQFSSAVPATIMVKLMAAAKKGQLNLSDADAMALAYDIYGKKTLEEWCAKGLTLDQLTEIMLWTFEQLNMSSAAEGDNPKNAPAAST